MRCVDCVLLHEQRGGTDCALAVCVLDTFWPVCCLVCAAGAEICCDGAGIGLIGLWLEIRCGYLHKQKVLTVTGP